MTSFMGLINALVKVNNIDGPYKIVERRQVDLATSHAVVKKDKQNLGWRAELGIEEMLRDSWKFELNND